MTNELSDTRTFTYDDAGKLTERIDRLGRKIEYVYDKASRQTHEKWYDGTTLVRTIAYTFDAAGRLDQATDPAATYGYNYDALGRNTYESQSFAGLSPLIEYERTFDGAHQLTAFEAILAGTADFVNAYTYDHLNRLDRVTQQDASGGNVVADKRADFSYNNGGQFTKITRYGDLSTNEHVASSHYSYDDIGRLKQLTHSTTTTAPSSGWGTGPLAGYQFTYDAASRIGSIDSYVDGLTSFTHDNTDQLKAADHTGQTDESYSYDENGNRTMSGHSVGTNNRLLSDGVNNYTYDDEGNRLTKTKISTGDKEEYTWDHRNRLTKITFKNSGGTVLKTVDQTYDVYNQWIRRSVDSDGPGSGAAVDTFFSYEAGQVALQFGGATAASLTHRYLWNPAAVDQLLADELVTSLSSAGTVQYPLGDHLGTLRELASYNAGTNTTTIDNHRRYDSYGNLTSETNAAIDQLFGYTGRAFDDSTRLQNNLYRWYDCGIGVWISEDPIQFDGDPSNLSRYVRNLPLNLIDPSGLQWKHPPGTMDLGGKVLNDAPDEVQEFTFYCIVTVCLSRIPIPWPAKGVPKTVPRTAPTKPPVVTAPAPKPIPKPTPKPPAPIPKPPRIPRDPKLEALDEVFEEIGEGKFDPTFPIEGFPDTPNIPQLPRAPLPPRGGPMGGPFSPN